MENEPIKVDFRQDTFKAKIKFGSLVVLLVLWIGATFTFVYVIDNEVHKFFGAEKIK